jgi:uncharacterized protein
MNSMAIDRRSLFLATLTALPAWSLTRALAGGGPEVAFVSSAKRADGTHAVLLLDREGRIVRDFALSARGHDIALDRASGRAVVFARRPGTFAVGFELDGAASPQIFTAIEGRHFYGHGAFSEDGRLLYVSENDIANGRGVIGMYDVNAGYKRVGEFSSHGVGPHEIILLSDGETLAVANGGIDTIPDSGREALNLESMQPSLVFVNSRSGALIAKHQLAPEASRLSIRHLAADSAGRVWFGGQWEGDPSASPELVGCAGPDCAIRLIAPAVAMGATLKGYIGSMAASADGRIVAASAPKAGRIIYIDAASGTVCGASDLKDGCGIAGDDGGTFAVTSGLGVFRYEVPAGGVVSEHALSEIAFDNHLRRLRS